MTSIWSLFVETRYISHCPPSHVCLVAVPDTPRPRRRPPRYGFYQQEVNVECVGGHSLSCGLPSPMAREIPSDRPGSTHYFTFYFSYNNYRRARSCAKYMNDNELRRPHRTDLHCDNPVAVAVASACAGYFTVTARGSQAGSRAADGVCGVTVRAPCRVGAGLVGLVGLSGLVVGEPLAAYICGTQ